MSKFKKYMLSANWLKTIAFNFKMFPVRQAIHLPVLLFGKVNISECKGRCEFIHEIPSNKLFAQVLIGNVYCNVHGHNIHPYHTHLAIQGLLRLGQKVFISGGSMVSVMDNATLSIDDYAWIAPNVKIACYESIVLEHHSRVAWETQIFDTNFHYTISSSGITHRITEPIHIQHNTWIGNRSNIMKGAKLGAHCILASNSLLNKDFSTFEGGVFAGSPAKLIKSDCYRLTNFEIEDELNKFFLNNQDINEYQIEINEKLFKNA